MARGLLKRHVLIVALVLLLAVGGYGGYRLWQRNHVPLADLRDAEVAEVTIGGQDARIITGEARKGPSPAAVILHGFGDDARTAIQTRAGAFTQTLIDAGWVVAASHAHGDAWGSPASQEDYATLIDTLRDDYEVDGVVLVAESMGSIAGLHLAASGQVQDLLGWVGLTPVTNLPAIADDADFSDSVDEALTDDQVEELDPLAIDPGRLAEVPLVMVTSTTDVVLPAAQHADPFAQRFPLTRVVRCSGGHLATDCFRADEVLDLAKAGV